MRLYSVLVGAALAVLGVTSVSAEIRIRHDNGGQIGHYMAAAQQIGASGQLVVIDGPCLSACTLLLAAVPRERICVTPRAALGFHAAWVHGMDGRRLVSPGGTATLMANYPEPIRRWIERKGGLSPRMIFLRGRELASYYQPCSARSRLRPSVAGLY
jgi:hypothetical protein